MNENLMGIKNMNENLKALIEMYYDDVKKDNVNKFIDFNSDRSDRHLVNYVSLSHAFNKEDYKHVSEKRIIEILDVHELAFLSEVDWVIADIIETLSFHLDEDISQGYIESLYLDNTQPELNYLVNKTGEYLNHIYEDKALIYVERYGIIDYTVEGNHLYYDEAIVENVGEQTKYFVKVNLDTHEETREPGRVIK